MDSATALPDDFVRLLPSAALLAYRIDPAADAIELVKVERGFYRQAPFLDQRAFAGLRLDGFRGRLSEVAALLPVATPPLRFIFHIGHCGSTLVSRSLDGLPGVLGLREPLPLLSLVAAAEALDSPLSPRFEAKFDALIGTVRKLLARGFAPLDLPVVKATSVVSVLAERLLGASDRAVFLSLPLPTYLAALLRDPSLRAAARLTARPRWADYRGRGGDAGRRLQALSDAECIALTWLIDSDRAERLATAADRRGRVLRLDFECWLRAPAAAMARVAQTLALPHTDESIASALQQAEPGRYAKDRQQLFDADTRRRELDQASRQFAAEIDQGRRFVESVLSRQPGRFLVALER